MWLEKTKQKQCYFIKQKSLMLSIISQSKKHSKLTTDSAAESSKH